MWVTSDYHLFHKNILNFTNSNGEKIRGQFDNVVQMNECILDNHNDLVKPGDIVYNLGDVTFLHGEVFENFFRKFNGRKRLVVGNHDDIPYLVKTGLFQKVLMWRKMTDKGLIFSHSPIHRDSCYNWKTETYLKNIHGHTHDKHAGTQDYVNVCVEETGFKPVNIEELRII